MLQGIKRADLALTAVVVALAALVGIGNMTAFGGAETAHPVESDSWLMVPVFVAAALTVLLRRSQVLVAVGAAFAILAASLPMFGWVTRCGFGLPLTFVLAYAVARYAGERQNNVIGLVGLLGLQVVVLVMDSSTDGLGALTLSLPLTALSYGIGLVVQRRSRGSAAAPTLSQSVHA